MTTVNLNTIGPVELAVAMSQIRPELVIPARLGLQIAALRAGSVDEDELPGGQWHRNNVLSPVTQLMQRRWPPTGDRALWIRYGPAGPPWWNEQRAAA